MATTKGPRYARLPLGLVERVLGLVSPPAALVYVRLRLSQEKRSVPGLLRLGEGGLADLLGLSPAGLRKALVELERAGLVLVDRAARLVYCLGAVEEDGPRTVQTVKAFASQLRELPADSRVTTEVTAAVGRALVSQHEALVSCWAAEVLTLTARLTSSLESRLEPRDAARESATLTVLPIPRSDPDPEGPIPMSKNGKAAAAPPSLSAGARDDTARNVGVITRIAHEVLDLTGVDADLGDQSEAVKSRCATLAIAYDSRTVAAALDSARHQRGLNGQAVRH